MSWAGWLPGLVNITLFDRLAAEARFRTRGLEGDVLGPQSYLNRPFRMEEVVSQVVGLLRQPGAASEVLAVPPGSPATGAFPAFPVGPPAHGTFLRLGA